MKTPVIPLEAGDDEQDLCHPCHGALVSDKMPVITDRGVNLLV
jgi:hypothetical protein